MEDIVIYGNVVGGGGSGPIDTSQLVGQKTKSGGEVFNDYENNKALTQYATAIGKNNTAGTKAFTITGWDENTKTYTLNSVEGLSVNDKISIEWVESYSNCSVLTAINTATNTITVDNFIIGSDTSDTIKKYLFIYDKPYLGNTSFGYGAYAEGTENIALLTCSHAEGRGNKSLGFYSHTEGRNTVAHYAAHAEGKKTSATGDMSHAEGVNTQASGHHAHAEGNLTIASGGTAHAEGMQTNAEGEYSHAEGRETKAVGVRSHAEGYYSEARGDSSHAEGELTVASGTNAHTEGWGTKAKGARTHAEGHLTEAFGVNSHTEGTNTITGKFDKNGDYIPNTGENAHAEGSTTRASGNNAHSEGSATNAAGESAHAEGFNCIAYDYAHAEGNGCTASNTGHAEGCECRATSGWISHAEGYKTKAGGTASHAQGRETEAIGDYSHAGGYGTKAAYESQTVVGKYNDNKSDTFFEVGNGTANAPSNAFEVKKSGAIVVGGVTLTPEQLTKLLALIN